MARNSASATIHSRTMSRSSTLCRLAAERRGASPRNLRPICMGGRHGKTLAFVGQRNGDFDIYTIPAAGGEEIRLTTAKGLDDGPEYTRDGKYIYFNSERTGHMQIWRM